VLLYEHVSIIRGYIVDKASAIYSYVQPRSKRSKQRRNCCNITAQNGRHFVVVPLCYLSCCIIITTSRSSRLCPEGTRPPFVWRRVLSGCNFYNTLYKKSTRYYREENKATNTKNRNMRTTSHIVFNIFQSRVNNINLEDLMYSEGLLLMSFWLWHWHAYI